MIVSWNWLEQYVTLEMSVETLTDRLTMTGLNLEGIEQVEGDTAIDLEVTSNRPDCLGHLGVAREIAALFDHPLQIPAAQPVEISEKTSAVTSVEIDCEDLCPQYIARVIRGVKIGPSPQWLQDRLKALGIVSINNIVDITNYVLMECGQPLHAFDFDKLAGQKIIVRQAKPGEKIVAINQKEYPLDDSMCVICDSEKPVAIGGVMGGLATEIGEQTVNVLIESAAFAPMSIRNTARKLNLHSDSSYRFERALDPAGVEWASRRCCELILELAGGELLSQAAEAGKTQVESADAIKLRFDQITRILGIEIPVEDSLRILSDLGLHQVGAVQNGFAEFTPPSWRRDLTREIDLIEEIARVYGYDQIPEDRLIPIIPTMTPVADRVAEKVRTAMTAGGFYEALTLSFITEELSQLFTPYTDREWLKVDHSSRRQENLLRQSLVPHLLECRRENERHGTSNAQLFEIAKVYLSADRSLSDHETEPQMITFVSGMSFSEMKGIVESLARSLNRTAEVSVRPSDIPQFVPGRGAEVLLNGKHWGWMGEIDRQYSDRIDLSDAVTVAELHFSVLEEVIDLAPHYEELPQFPGVSRDVSLLLDESVTWQELEEVVRGAAGPLLDSVSFGGQYRGKQIEAGKKSYVVTMNFRSAEKTLTHEEVEQPQTLVVQACEAKLGASQR